MSFLRQPSRNKEIRTSNVSILKYDKRLELTKNKSTDDQNNNTPKQFKPLNDELSLHNWSSAAKLLVYWNLKRTI